MGLRVEQNIEEHGIHRTLSGYWAQSDFSTLFSAQSALDGFQMRYAIVDALAVEGTDDQWPRVFAAIQKPASDYLPGLHVIFIADNPSIKGRILEYFSYFTESNWVFKLVETEAEAREYIAEHVL